MKVSKLLLCKAAMNGIPVQLSYSENRNVKCLNFGWISCRVMRRVGEV